MWLKPRAVEMLRSVEGMRIGVALVLLVHPLHAVLHPEDAAAWGVRLAQHGVPSAHTVAWLGLALIGLGAVALLLRRMVAPAAGLLMLTIGTASLLLFAPRWFVLGGDAVDGEPGLEYSVLLLVMLAGIGWVWRAGEHHHNQLVVGFHVVTIGSALSMLPHGYGAFIKLDFEGMRAWGEGMSQLGFPLGVQLVWSVKIVELLGLIGRVSRRLVVPACIGHLAVLLPGMVISQKLQWFNVGPAEGGIEFPVVLALGAVVSIFAYWPRSSSASTVAPK